MVRAKFTVQNRSTHEFAGGFQEVRVDLYPVTSGTEEDKAFWAATPAGKIEMTIKTDAAQAFTPGKTFYVDFTEATE